MMNDSAAHTVFATPELTFPLFAYLSPSDLTQCIRVCRQWMQHAGPVLWRNFSPGLHYCPAKTTCGLVRNLLYVRTVELSFFDDVVLHVLVHGVPQSQQPGDSPAVSSTRCTHLRQLIFKSLHALHEWFELTDNFCLLLPSIVTLLHHNVRLTHLTLPFSEVDVDDPVLAAIANLRHLQYLTIDNFGLWPISTRAILILLQACLPLPKLTGLKIDIAARIYGSSKDGDRDMGLPSLETIIEEAARARFSQIPTPGKIKSLALPAWPADSGNPLALPLLKSGLLDLESCTVLSFMRDLDPKYVEKIVREYCPHLKHVRCPSSFSRLLVERQHLCAFIRGCSGLQGFVFDGFRESTRHAGAGPFQERHAISNLVTHHSDTLEDLELKNCTDVLAIDQQAILSCCKQLKRYHDTPNPARQNAGFNVEDVSKGDWVCTELRELRMTLPRGSARSPSAAKWFYTQIGRLEKLEWLAFDVHQDYHSTTEARDYAWDLTMSKGWLREMVGLKTLRGLSLEAEFCRDMRQDEVEFMHEHWPMLCEVNIAGRDVSQLHTLAHWRWLLDKRPHLRFNTQDRSQQ